MLTPSRSQVVSDALSSRLVKNTPGEVTTSGCHSDRPPGRSLASSTRMLARYFAAGAPSHAARTAALRPAGPAPTTMMS